MLTLPDVFDRPWRSPSLMMWSIGLRAVRALVAMRFSCFKSTVRQLTVIKPSSGCDDVCTLWMRDHARCVARPPQRRDRAFCCALGKTGLIATKQRLRSSYALAGAYAEPAPECARCTASTAGVARPALLRTVGAQGLPPSFPPAKPGVGALPAIETASTASSRTSVVRENICWFQ